MYQISLSWEKKLRWQKLMITFLAQAASIRWKLIKNGHLRNHTLKRSKKKTRRDHKFNIECWLFHLLISAICSFGWKHKVEIRLDGFKSRLLPDELLTLWEKIDSSRGKSRTSKIWYAFLFWLMKTIKPTYFKTWCAFNKRNFEKV